MASLLVERFRAPAGTRDSRAFDRRRKRMLDAPAVDAYLLTSTTADGAHVVAAPVPGAGMAFAKEECVAGTRHARPAVAPR